MYLAKTRKHRQTAYFLRESTPEGNGSGFQEICSLGPEPGAWVDYPGGNAWHVCPELINRIAKKPGSLIRICWKIFSGRLSDPISVRPQPISGNAERRSPTGA